MVLKFQTGDIKEYKRLVTEKDLAEFESGQVHAVYATFALARDAEWVCRLFVLEMKEEDEEGIGTFVDVAHMSPALLGEVVHFTAEIERIKGNEIICSYEARVDDRLIAKGRQIQKILKKDRVRSIFGKAGNGE